jgi:adenylate cyclase class 2
MAEVEIKARVSDFDAIRERLKEMDAKKLKTVKQVDTIYGSPHKDMAKTRELLRVRNEDGEHTICYKKRLDPLEEIKRCIEVESKTHENIHEILKDLGFQVSMVNRKVREYWLLNDVYVCLDEVDRLGTFIELESKNKTESNLFKMLDKLGIPRENVVSEAYPDMLTELQQKKR